MKKFSNKEYKLNKSYIIVLHIIFSRVFIMKNIRINSIFKIKIMNINFIPDLYNL